MSKRSHAETLARIHKAVSTNDDTILTEDEAKLMDELRTAFEMLLSGEYTQQQVVSELKQKYGIGDVTATGRIRDCKQVYGDVTKGQRAMDAHIAYMRAEKVYMMAMGLDAEKADPELLKQMAPDEQRQYLAMMTRKVNLETALQAINTMVRIRGLDKEESQLIDPSKLGGTVHIMLNPQDRKAMKQWHERGAIDMSELYTDAEDAQVIEEQPEPLRIAARDETA